MCWKFIIFTALTFPPKHCVLNYSRPSTRAMTSVTDGLKNKGRYAPKTWISLISIHLQVCSLPKVVVRSLVQDVQMVAISKDGLAGCMMDFLEGSYMLVGVEWLVFLNERPHRFKQLREKDKFSPWIREILFFPAWFREMTHF